MAATRRKIALRSCTRRATWIVTCALVRRITPWTEAQVAAEVGRRSFACHFFMEHVGLTRSYQLTFVS